MASVTPPVEVAICDMPIIPWNPNIHTKYSPSVLVFTLAIGWYYLNGMWAPNSPTAGGWTVPFLFVIVLALAQTGVIIKQRACPPTMTFGLIAAWVIGILSGTIGYWVAYYWMLPGAAAPTPVIFGAGGTLNPNVGGAVTEHFGLFDVNSGVSFNQQKGKTADSSSTVNLALPSTSDHCKVPDDDTYYVDLYKDGQLITESIGEKLLS
jgi:hypothetical protein